MKNDFTVKFLFGRMLSNLEMTLDWAAQSLKLHQFWYAGAPLCPCTSPIKSSHIGLNCQVGKIRAREKQTRFFPERPRTCFGWRCDPRVEYTQWMLHSQIQAKQIPFWPSRPSFPCWTTVLKTWPAQPSDNAVV
jgi:hypothetical protein